MFLVSRNNSVAKQNFHIELGKKNQYKISLYAQSNLLKGVKERINIRTLKWINDFFFLRKPWKLLLQMPWQKRRDMHHPLIVKCSVPKWLSRGFQACPKPFMFYTISNVVLYACSQFKSQKRYIIGEISIGNLRIIYVQK